ncbi:MAG: biotin synthase BioB [Deltaproteobacteria bacterium]|nr:MAG: biotin synthase BioB [Deltaproteobacteria bacterium]
MPTKAEIAAIYDQPFMDLVFEAASVHRAHHDPNQLQWSTLLSIKTGACPEDCTYCSQSARWNTGLEKEPLLNVEQVLANAEIAKANGSTRFCMGAAWRRVPNKAMPELVEMVKGVRAMGMETCMTLGTVDAEQAKTLAEAGLDYYNHNLDTSEEHYGKVITTRTYQERLDTLQTVRDAGMNVCCGGILGLGEENNDRIGLLWQLANLEQPPESVPVNSLVAIEGTPLADQGVEPVDGIDMVRFIATARILMPKSYIRLSAGREEMTDELQALCLLAGANSMFTGEQLLTTKNPAFERDKALLKRLGMRIERIETAPTTACSTGAAAAPAK